MIWSSSYVRQCIDNHLPLSHSLPRTFPHSHILILPHSHTPTLSYSHTSTLSHSHTPILSHSSLSHSHIPPRTSTHTRLPITSSHDFGHYFVRKFEGGDHQTQHVSAKWRLYSSFRPYVLVGLLIGTKSAVNWHPFALQALKGECPPQHLEVMRFIDNSNGLRWAFGPLVFKKTCTLILMACDVPLFRCNPSSVEVLH